jgi:hypothetical protein
VLLAHADLFCSARRMSVEIIMDDCLGRRVVWTIACEAVQRLRPKTIC